MKFNRILKCFAALALLAVAACSTGCQHHLRAKALYQPPPAVAPLGAINNAIWQSQEARAEASEFIVYQHEWGYQSAELNTCGMNHVTQIAARLCSCPEMPVVIEPSMMTVRTDTEFQYPVHPNPELDLRRREVVVLALQQMGVPDVEKRVLVAPAYAEAASAVISSRVYNQGLNGGGFFGGGGFGGGFGGFGSSFGGGGFGFGGFGGGVF